MARMARVVVPGMPHHVVQRGVRSMRLFFSVADREAYLAVLAEEAEARGLAFWAWSLMPDEVHLVAVPESRRSLSAIGKAHRRHARDVNRREGVRGHLFDGRFSSCVVQPDRHLLEVVRYVELLPVRVGLARRAGDYRWSSARHHLLGTPDPLVAGSPVRRMARGWGRFLRPTDQAAETVALIELHARTGRPWGDADWSKALERRLRRPLLPRTPGPKPRGT